jgi:hypothetical protein
MTCTKGPGWSSYDGLLKPLSGSKAFDGGLRNTAKSSPDSRLSNRLRAASGRLRAPRSFNECQGRFPKMSSASPDRSYRSVFDPILSVFREANPPFQTAPRTAPLALLLAHKHLQHAAIRTPPPRLLFRLFPAHGIRPLPEQQLQRLSTLWHGHPGRINSVGICGWWIGTVA